MYGMSVLSPGGTETNPPSQTHIRAQFPFQPPCVGLAPIRAQDQLAMGTTRLGCQAAPQVIEAASGSSPPAHLTVAVHLLLRHHQQPA
jgi:hypothetical protein